jgi:protein-disulfide isomerase
MHNATWYCATAVMLAALPAGQGRAAGGSCSALTDEQASLAKEIAAGTWCYDCCDETVDKCLKKKKVCRLAVRLSNEICSRVKRGQDKEKIKDALARRAKSMMPSAKKYAIDTSSLDTWVGEKDAKVQLVSYLCARCPFCAKIIPKLHKEVTTGRLKGKVRIHVRIFPIKSHKWGVEGGLSMAAAAKLGKFWPYLLKLYGSFDDFSVDKLVPWAKETGMDGAAFKSIMEKQETKLLVVESKKEGLKNGVEGTPTFYINNRKYYGDHTMEYFVDAIEEEYDNVTGKIYTEDEKPHGR